MEEFDITSLKQKADDGELDSCTSLGIKYLEGDGVEQSFKIAENYLKKSALAGDPVAQYRYAIILYLGLNEKKPDVRRAVNWLLKSAVQNYGPALRDYALCFANGIGVPANYRTAFNYLLLATKANNYDAMVDLADFYEQGILNAENKDEYVKELYQKAAEQNISTALNKIGSWYYDGIKGYEKDLDKASEYFKKAAEFGLINARFNLAMVYKDQNKTSEFVATLEESVNDGFLPAFETLALCYFNGDGVAKDILKAKSLYIRLMDYFKNRKPHYNVKQFVQTTMWCLEDGKSVSMITHLKKAIADIDKELKSK
ncbi:MAG: tetratricopeptide repeat protein [Succinivibrionaceae bacterium]